MTGDIYENIQLYFEAANNGKYIVWCDNWCVLVEVEDIEFAIYHTYWTRFNQIMSEVSA